MLNYNSSIFAHHLQGNFDFKNVVGKLSQHPTQPGKWGLTNNTGDNWNFTRPSGESAIIPPGKNAPLLTGGKINFGTATGEFE